MLLQCTLQTAINAANQFLNNSSAICSTIYFRNLWQFDLTFKRFYCTVLDLVSDVWQRSNSNKLGN